MLLQLLKRAANRDAADAMERAQSGLGGQLLSTLQNSGRNLLGDLLCDPGRQRNLGGSDGGLRTR